MQIKQRLQGRLAMTFSLSQALKILQMPQIELAQWLLTEIERNPILELDETDSFQSFEMPQIAAPPSLHDHLMNQMREYFSEQQGENILKHLDEKGYLTTSLEELEILQTFDPPGIFARDLRECFLLQLKEQQDSSAYRIVNSCFEDFLHGRFEKIKKQLGISNLSDALHVLSLLNSLPSHLFKK